MSNQQSPIALYNEKCVSREFPPLIFSNYDKKYNMLMVNRGHTVQVNLAPSEKDIPKVSGGRLPGNFIFHNIHFHWTAEHTINGERYPLEAHLVHFNEKYKTIDDSFSKEDGIAVFSVMFKVELKCGCKTVFAVLTDLIEQIAKQIDKPVKLSSSISLNQFLPRNTSRYFSYDGSLTTPEYMEYVNWTVFSSVMMILKHEYEKLIKIYGIEGGLLERNSRSLQDLIDIPVYFRK